MLLLHACTISPWQEPSLAQSVWLKSELANVKQLHGQNTTNRWRQRRGMGELEVVSLLILHYLQAYCHWLVRLTPKFMGGIISDHTEVFVILSMRLRRCYLKSEPNLILLVLLVGLWLGSSCQPKRVGYNRLSCSATGSQMVSGIILLYIK
jgi:hypothetical protein